VQPQAVAVGEVAAQDGADDPFRAGYEDGLQTAESNGAAVGL
jgi:hypothetical protein